MDGAFVAARRPWRTLRRITIVVGLVLIGSLAPSSVPSEATTVWSTCGYTATTDVVLASDLVCDNSTGLIVGAAGITIDLGGHTLSSNQAIYTKGIDGSG